MVMVRRVGSTKGLLVANIPKPGYLSQVIQDCSSPGYLSQGT